MVDKFIDTENRIVVSRGWEEGAGERVSNGDRVSVLQNKEFWRWNVMFVQLYTCA